MQTQYLNTSPEQSSVTSIDRDALQRVCLPIDHQQKQLATTHLSFEQYSQYISVEKSEGKNEQGETSCDFTFKINYSELANQIDRLVTASNYSTFTLLGPVSYLYLLQQNLLNTTDTATELVTESLSQLLSLYNTIFTVLNNLTIEKVQLDEPILALP